MKYSAGDSSHAETGSTTAQLRAHRRSAQPVEQSEILPAFTSELAGPPCAYGGVVRRAIPCQWQWGHHRHS